MVSKIDTIRLVAKGNMRTILSFLKTRSPGNLKSGIFGNSKKIDPVMTKTRPRIMRNRARLCTNTNLFLLFVRNVSRRFGSCFGFFKLCAALFSFFGQMRFFVIGHVEPTTFEYQTRAPTYQPSQSPAALRAFCQRFVGDLLEFVKCVFTIRTLVFVSRHSSMRRVRVRRLECLPP
jgi:hypothetical protein